MTTSTGTRAQTSCVAGTIYHSKGDQAPIMNYQCWPEWDDGSWTATRITTEAETTTEPSTTTDASTASSESETESESGSESSSQSLSNSSSSDSNTEMTRSNLQGGLPSETGTGSAANGPEEPNGSTGNADRNRGGSGESKAWIAGPVAGGVAGVALLMLLGFFLYRKRAKVRKHQSHMELPERGYSVSAELPATETKGYYAHESRPPAELSGAAIYELPVQKMDRAAEVDAQAQRYR